MLGFRFQLVAVPLKSKQPGSAFASLLLRDPSSFSTALEGSRLVETFNNTRKDSIRRL